MYLSRCSSPISVAIVIVVVIVIVIVFIFIFIFVFLPDPGVVWDSLLKRDKFVAHPSGISSLLFGFAQLIVHSIFQTDPRNGEVNEASSYLDLSPIDEDIVKVLLETTDNVASAFKARAIPEVMRAIDLLGMEAARKSWRCCTMNAFREFLGLKKYSSFDEWNPDKSVARAAEKLYKHVDHLELYPGLMAEEPKPSMDG
ncbi:hypothetical protein JCM3775_005665 [Rhodotorula graminis]